VGTGAPHVSPGNNRSILGANILIVQSSFAFGAGLFRSWITPDLSPFYAGSTVSNRHVSHTNGLHHAGLLAGARRPNFRKRRRANADHKQRRAERNAATF